MVWVQKKKCAFVVLSLAWGSQLDAALPETPSSSLAPVQAPLPLECLSVALLCA